MPQRAVYIVRTCRIALMCAFPFVGNENQNCALESISTECKKNACPSPRRLHSRNVVCVATPPLFICPLPPRACVVAFGPVRRRIFSRCNKSTHTEHSGARTDAGMHAFPSCCRAVFPPRTTTSPNPTVGPTEAFYNMEMGTALRALLVCYHCWSIGCAGASTT